MNTKILYWLPRVMAVMFVIYMGIFAVDAVDSNYDFPDILLASAMHSVPTALVVLAGLFAWKQEYTGGLLFVTLGLVYIILGWGDKPVIAFFCISGPLFLIGALFILNDYLKKLSGPYVKNKPKQNRPLS